MFIPTGRLVAAAQITGGVEYPQICGTLKLYQSNPQGTVVQDNQLNRGTLVEIAVCGLPTDFENMGVFALHIHEGGACTGRDFADSGSHFNPGGAQHPYHAGDLPPLFAYQGRAFMLVQTERFNPEEVIGRTVIIHRGVDDFTTQPAGNSGLKMACGVIRGV